MDRNYNMKFAKRFLQDVISNKLNFVKLIENTVIGKDINNIYNMLLFKHNGRYYRKFYSTKKSESHIPPFVTYDNEIECEEVIPVEKTITTYESVKRKDINEI